MALRARLTSPTGIPSAGSKIPERLVPCPARFVELAEARCGQSGFERASVGRIASSRHVASLPHRPDVVQHGGQRHAHLARHLGRSHRSGVEQQAVHGVLVRTQTGASKRRRRQHAQSLEDLTITVLPGGWHGLTISPNGLASEEATSKGFGQGLFTDIADWSRTHELTSVTL